MTASLYFAHVTDIHITDRRETWSTLGEEAPHLFRVCVEQLNRLEELDFVLITGDVLDMATPSELERFLAVLSELRKPWHFTPGNHDGFIDPDHPTAYKPHEAVPLIDPRMASPTPEAQRAYWSRSIRPGVRLIGLDSRMPDNWNGEINAAQLAWLEAELRACRDELVIVGVHHPLHRLGPHNTRLWWSNFICDNGAEVERVLGQHPGVKLVLAGHHHANQIRRRGGRLHVNTAALTGYPCTYRLIRMTPRSSGWRIQIESRPVADEALRKKAYDALIHSKTAHRFNPDDPSSWAAFCEGRIEDRTFEGELS